MKVYTTTKIFQHFTVHLVLLTAS